MFMKIYFCKYALDPHLIICLKKDSQKKSSLKISFLTFNILKYQVRWVINNSMLEKTN